MAISKDTSLKMLRWFKEALDENIDAKIVTLSGGGGELNVIEAISIDGTPQTVTDKIVQLDLSAYAKKTDVTSAVSTISGTTIVSGESYELPPATTTTLGGVIVGGGLGVNSTGTLRVTISGGQSNVIESISIDGTPQTVTDKTVQLNLSNYAKQADLTSAVKSISSLKTAIETIADGKINVIESISLDGKEQTITADKTVNLNLSNYAEKTDLAGSIRMKGSVTAAKLPTTTALVGDMYNLTTSYTNSDSVQINAGTNVVFTADGTWDAMAGYVDRSNLVKKVTGRQLSTNDFTDEEKTKLQGLKNYTLERANATLLGGVMVGAGLSMTGDSLNADIYDVFEGATATESGDVGLIPAPKTGEQQKFLCSNGQWVSIQSGENINIFASGYTPDALAVDVLSYSSEDMTLEASSPPTNTQGALYMGIVQDECCLKLFSGDYEYTFNPDVFDIATVKPPPPADYVQGQIYYLNTAPSAANGTLWYTTEGDGGLDFTKLCAHRKDANYTFDFFFNHDIMNPNPITYYSYLPFKRSISDMAGKRWSNNIGTPVIEETDFEVPALRNMDKSLANTVSTTSGLAYTLPSALSTFTIDFWLSWNEDKNSGDNAAAVGASNTYHEIFKSYHYEHTKDAQKYFLLRVLNNNLLAYNYRKTIINHPATYTWDHYIENPAWTETKVVEMPNLIIGEENIFTQKSAQRFHIAITKTSIGDLNIFVNGKNIKSTVQNNLTAIELFPYCVGADTSYRGLYIDHFRIRNSVVWSGDFPPPQEDDYIYW